MNVVNLDIYVAVILTVIKNRRHCTRDKSTSVQSLQAAAKGSGGAVV